MITLLIGFYSDDEILAAKELLYCLTDDTPTKLDGLPRHIKHKISDIKKQQDCADLLKLYSFLDEKKVDLPRFMAGNLSRLPTVKPGEVDIYCMAVSITNMAQQLQTLTSRITALELSKQAATGAVHRQENPPSTNATSTASETERAVTTTPENVQETPSPPVKTMSNWAGIASQSSDQWKTVQSKKPAAIRFKGSKSAVEVGEKLRTVPRRAVLAAFVGRLHPDTTEEELHQFLSDEGLKGVVCKKLSSKNGTVYKTAAFYVSCSTDSRDLFYNEQCWPDGVELRDWIYRERERQHIDIR